MKMKKGPLQCGKCVDNWRNMVVYFLLLCVVTILGRLCFLLGFNAGASMSKMKGLRFAEYNDQFSLEHLNVSRNQFYALASLFSESDQIASIDCKKELGSENSGVACALSLSFREKMRFQQKHRGIIRYVDQCPILDQSISRKLDVSLRRDMSVESGPQHIISSFLPGEDHEKNILQRCDPWNQIKEHENCLSFVSFLKGCCGIIFGMIMSCKLPFVFLNVWRKLKQMLFQRYSTVVQQNQQSMGHPPQQPLPQSPPKSAANWRRILLYIFVLVGIVVSVWLFWHLNHENTFRRKETLINMCDERARVLQDQFNVSMNHVHALAILVSTFHHGKHPSAIDQKTFCEYTERTSFERPLTSGVAYALRVPHSEREKFETRQRWKIKKMVTEDQTLVHDFVPGNLDPAPIQDEYAPVIFSQETVSHIVSIDMMSGKEDRENILRARASGKGVLTSPFKLLKSNHLGVILTFAVYKTDLPLNATPEQRTEATLGYLGASYDVPSLVERLLHQLASKQTIDVNVYDTTNASAPIGMYGTDVVDTGHLHISHLDFGDPNRKHEMHCRFKQKAPPPWTAIMASAGALVITFLVGYIFFAAISRITEVENDCREMERLKVCAEAADVAKSQFLATVSHEIRTPMNGVLGMLQMLMDTELDATQRDYAQTAHASGKDLISLINEVLDQAKIESGRLELEDVPFDLRAVLDNVLSLFSSKSIAKAIELAVYVSDKVPQVVIGDPGRFRQIITNLVGNSIKFTRDKGHVFVSVHMADEIWTPTNSRNEVLEEGLHLVRDSSDDSYNTLSGFPVVNRSKSWEVFKNINEMQTASEAEMVKLLVTVEDTGVGIPPEAQHRIFTPFMQADSSTSRTYGGTGIGLSISKRLVELMKGKIDFVSELGTGSTFSFTCVFKKSEKSSLDTKSQLYDPVLSKLQGLRALIIDKRSTRAEVTRYHLQRLGIFADISLTLESACSLLTNRWNLSTLTNRDMVLIEKDVWDKDFCVNLQPLINELRQKRSADSQNNFPKIYLLASSISSSERTELKFSGLIDNVLLKPLRLSVLIACFQETLEIGKKGQVTRRKPPTFGDLLKGKQILVVDDNMVNRRVAEGALKKYGAIVTCVDSGKAALLMLNPPHNFDACFMDLQMPEMDGFEATRQIRDLEKMVNKKIESGEESADLFANVAHWHTPILAMTADVIQATTEECMRSGMDGYVSKPFEEQQLYSAVARFFESG